MADYGEVIRLDPKNASAYNARGAIWHIKREYDKATADFDEAIRIDPRYVNAYGSRGDVWLAKKEYDRAMADYGEVIRLDPEERIRLQRSGGHLAHQARVRQGHRRL